MDYLQSVDVPPMIWSPLAGGQIFTGKDERSTNVRKVLEDLSKDYRVETDVLAYAWLLKHPVRMMPICGSGKIERVKNAVKALDVELKHEDWYKIYVASKDQELR